MGRSAPCRTTGIRPCRCRGFRLAFACAVAGTGAAAAAQEPAAPAPDAEAAEKEPAENAEKKTPPEPATAAKETPEITAGPVEETKKAETGYPVHGYLSARYRVRWTDENSDQDVYQTLALDAGDRSRHAVTVHFLGRLSEDADGSRDRDGFYVFDSLEDTFEHSVNGKLYHGYIDIHRVPRLDVVRAGRQTMYETPESLHFDGGRIETEDLWSACVRAGVYGGIPVHLWESSPDGDYLAGAFLQSRPWKAGRVRADWTHVTDENFYGRRSDDLYGVSVWQGLGEYVQLHGLYTRLEDESRDLLARATFQKPEWDFRLQGSFYDQIKQKREYAFEFDPFYAATFEYAPYFQYRLIASKGLGEHVVIDAGFDVRRLKYDDDQGYYNRDFVRWFVTASLRDLLAKGLTLSATGEFWGSDGGDILTGGGDATYAITDWLRASAGSFFSLYKYDVYGSREIDNVRTYYAKLQIRCREQLRIEAGYDIDDEDGEDDVHTVKAGFTWSF